MTLALRRHPLTVFFMLAYAGSWVTWSPWWLSHSGVGLLPYELPSTAVAVIQVAGYFTGPFAAAYLMTRVTEGHHGIRRFWSGIVQWRVHPGWYVLASLAVPAAVRIGYLLNPGPSSTLDAINPTIIGLLAGTFVIYLFGGPLQEELGWRGFALPRLQQRHHPLTAAFVLGIIHCFWHAPLWLTDGWDTARQDPSQYLAYLLLVVSMSFIMSWLFNGSRGSVLLVVLGHNSINWGLTLTNGEAMNNWPATIGLMVLAILTAIITRGRLGYNPPNPRICSDNPPPPSP